MVLCCFIFFLGYLKVAACLSFVVRLLCLLNVIIGTLFCGCLLVNSVVFFLFVL